MDYTTVALVKEALRIAKTTEDSLIQRCVTAASRTLDKMCARSERAVDYFKQEDVAGELLVGRADTHGHLKCWPHKSSVNSVASLSFRRTPLETWQAVPPDWMTVAGMHTVEVWTALPRLSPGYFVRLSYSGGAFSAQTDIVADLMECATLLAGRYYRESETGMNDAMGIAELGSLTYTKAVPQRVRELIKPYIRTVPW